MARSATCRKPGSVEVAVVTVMVLCEAPELQEARSGGSARLSRAVGPPALWQTAARASEALKAQTQSAARTFMVPRVCPAFAAPVPVPAGEGETPWMRYMKHHFDVRPAHSIRSRWE